MAKCINCEKSGIFLKITPKGLCEKCRSEIRSICSQNMIRYNYTLEFANDPANPFDLKCHIKSMKELIGELLVFEKKGIDTIEPKPSHILEKLKKDNDLFYKNCFQSEFDDLAVTIANMKVKSAIINRIDKFIVLINEYIPELIDSTCLNSIQKKAEKLKMNFSA